LSKNEDNIYNTDVHKVKLILWWISLTYSTLYQHTYDIIYDICLLREYCINTNTHIFRLRYILVHDCIYTHIVKVVTISYDITFIHISSDLTTFGYHFILIQISSDLRYILIPYYIFTHIVWLVHFNTILHFYIYRLIGYILIPYYIFTYIVWLVTFWYHITF
jgi:hypothetical protein